MTFKTWINDLRDVQSVINNISNTRVIIDGATGLLNTNSLKEMSSAVSGLSKEQALLVLYTKNLNAAQQEQVLLAAGIISSENSITASAISQALAKTQLSATEKEALLTKLGLIDATTGEAIANATCTKEELLKVLATKGIIGTDADAIISSIGLTSANSAQAISFDLLTASIWANIKALGKWLITNPVGWAIIGGTAILCLVKAYDALTDSVEEVQERTDKLLDSYNSAISEANSNAKTIESLADRYGELSKGVNNLGENVSLTSDEYSEYKEIVDQIAEMFPTLITGYTDEGTAILSLKGNVEKLRDAYKEAQTEAYNLLIVSGEDSDGNDIISNYKNQVNGNESWLSKQSSYIDGEGGAKDAIDIITKLTGALTPDEFRDTYNELYEQYKNIWNSDKIQEALKSSGFEELSHAPKWGELTSDDLAKVKSTAQATVQTYKAEIDSRLKNVDTLANAYLMTNEDYSKLDEQSQTAASLIVNSITEDIANGFHLKEDVGAYVADIVSKIKDNPDLNKSLIDLFTEDFSSMSVDEAKSKLNGYINTIAKALDEDPVELKVRLGFDDYNDNDIEPLKTKVQGFLKDEFDDKVGELSLDDLQVASKLEIPEGILLSWDELKQKIEETKNAVSNDTFSIPDAETLEQQISDLNSAIDSIQSAYDTLNSAVEEYNFNGGQLSIDTIQSLLSLSDEYLACLQVENGQLSLNADAMAQLAQAKLNEAQATAVTQAMTELQAIANGEAAQSTTNYITGNAALMSSLAQLSGSYEGVAQAAMTAAQAQELSAQISAAASKDKTATENVMKGLDNKLKLIQATKTTISAGNFAKVAKKSSSSKSGSSSKNYETELKKQLESIKTEYEKGSITLDEYYEKSLSLIKQYYDEGKIEASDFYDNNKSLLDDYLKYLEIAYKRGSMPYGEYFAKYLKAVQDCYDKGAISTEEYWNYNKELLDDYVDSAKKILDNLYDHKSMQAAGVSDLKQYLTTCYEMIKSFYNQGKISAYDYYNYLSDFYDYQISIYDKVIDAVTNKLDDQIDALEKQKDQIEKNYKAQIDVLEKEKDALEAENDARQDAIDLQKALYEMNRAQNQRTDLVYKDGQMVYVADQQGIRDKKDELDDLEYQRKIKEIEKRISSLEKTMDSLTDGIDQQIEDLNNYKDQWEDVKNKFIEQQNELLAEQIVGKDWEIDIQNMRMEALVEFTNKYIAMQQAQADAAVAAANKIVEAQRSIAAMQNTTPTTISTPSTSNSSSGGSGGSNKNTTFKSNNIKAEVRSVVSPGYKTSGEASSKISSYNGNGVMKKNGKWYVYKKYASGTDNAEKGWHIVSEDNIGDEIVIDNNGNAVIPHGEQLYNFQGGEQVIPANESKEIIENQGNVEKIPTKVVLGDGTVLTPVSHVMEISDSIRQSMMKNVALPNNIGQRNYENLMKNANSISNVNNNQPTDNSISIGEIHLNDVQNVDALTKGIIHKFPGKMRQALYSR